jgi:hypothetical protein
MILATIDGAEDLNNVADYLQKIGKNVLNNSALSYNNQAFPGRSNDHVFVNSEKRYRAGWNLQIKTESKMLTGRKMGECLTMWNRALYTTACNQPAHVLCEDAQ